MLSSLLEGIKDEKKVSLAVADNKLGSAINKLPGFDISAVSDSSTSDLFRAIREHLPSLISGLSPEDISTMSLGLSHSLSRHKLKFSPDKVDTMIIQAIHLLDDLDKELNMYSMRVREWYGWHFPEMAKIINDNLAYARVVKTMGMRTSASKADLSDVLPEEIETAVKAAAEVSMGTEIADEDLENIQNLADHVESFSEYRAQLTSYLSTRMQAIAPNLTALVGELVGARLIAHAGSLLSLAKSPASTIQILGAEKALFKALKTKHDTPKYGLIFHASLIGQASGKHKGKIARMLASKAALSLRVDALSDWGTSGDGGQPEPTEEQKAALGNESRLRIERRLRGLEGRPLGPKGVDVGADGEVKGKWEVKEARKYNPAADGLYGDETPGKGGDDGKKKLVKEVAMDDAESEDEASDEEMDDAPETNGKPEKELTKEERKELKQAKKTAKLEKSLEKAEKKAKKAEKKAKKEEKKRKRESDVGADGEKKKKKKSKD
jgi:nucleolar protein 58